MEQAIERVAPNLPTTVEEVVRQTMLIQDVMAAVMIDGQHYGTIPGCGPKPTLLKPGAEKLTLTFHFCPKFVIERMEMSNGHREYGITCSLFTRAGEFIAEGVGACSTMESRYRYRKLDRSCPVCGVEGSVIAGKEEFGGGWLCWKKKDGCGAKFDIDDPDITQQTVGKVEHDNPADYYNTALKIGKKRAFIDAVLTATGASDIFAQDLEDLARTEGRVKMADEALLKELTAIADDAKTPQKIRQYITGQLDGDALTEAKARKILARAAEAIKEAGRKMQPEVEYDDDPFGK